MGRFDPLPTDPYRDQPRVHGALCAACREVTRLGTKFCSNCSAFRDDAERGHTIRYATSRWMRFAARIVDSVIVVVLSIVVFFILESAGVVEFDAADTESIAASDLNLSVLVGTAIWFLWFAIVAPRGQTPGKQIVRTRVITAEGQDVSPQRIWLREGLFQGFPLLSSLFAEPIMTPPEAVTQLLAIATLFVLLDAVAIFFSSDRQTIHDRIFGTLVVNVRPVRQPSAELRAL